MSKLSKEQISALFLGRKAELLRFLSRRLPDEDVARDLAQDTYLRMLKFKKADQIRNLEAYLFRIAGNLVSEYWSSKSKRAAVEEEPTDFESLPGEQTPPDEALEKQRALEALQKAISLLPEVQQRVLVLHRRDGLTYDEIADELGISRDMVKKHLSKALVRCREYLKLARVEQTDG